MVCDKVVVSYVGRVNVYINPLSPGPQTYVLEQKYIQSNRSITHRLEYQDGKIRATHTNFTPFHNPFTGGDPSVLQMLLISYDFAKENHT